MSRGLAARRDLADRTQRAREMAQEADRLKFGLGEIDAVDPRPGEDGALVDDIRRLSELDALREAAQTARSALSGALDDAADADAASAAHEVGQAKTVLEATDDTALRALGERLAEALAVIGDVSTELGDYLTELPSDASTLETKLARQSELRLLTRKYAADIDGVLAWARESRERLAQLDVSEETLAGLERQVVELEAELVTAATELSKARTKAAKGLAKAVTAELSGLAMADAEFTVAVSALTVRGDDAAPITLPSGATVHAGSDGADAVEFGFCSASRDRRAAAEQERVRRRAVAGDARARGRPGRVRRRHHDGVRRGRRRRRRSRRGADRTAAGAAGAHPPGHRRHPPAAGRRVRRHPSRRRQRAAATSASGVRRLDDDDRVAELARMLAGLGDSDSGRAHARELLSAAQDDRAQVS